MAAQLAVCELVCVCVSLERVVVICPASTHTALVSTVVVTPLCALSEDRRERAFVVLVNTQ